MKITAVDPGSRYAAILTRDGDRLLSWAVLDRHTLTDRRLEAWIDRVTSEIQAHANRHAPRHVVVEGTRAPNPHVGMTNPEAIIETATLVGAAVSSFGALIMPPGQYGAPVPNRAVLLAAYPEDLVGPRETTGSGKGPRQHARAAWDLAAAARPRLLAQEHPR